MECIHYNFIIIIVLFLLQLIQSDSREIILNQCCSSNKNQESVLKLDNSNSSLFWLSAVYDNFCDKKPTRIGVNLDGYYTINDDTHFMGTQSNGDAVQIAIKMDGSIEIMSNSGMKHYSKTSYCIRKENSTWAYIEVCSPNKESGYRKCCPEGEGLELDNGCVPLDTSTILDTEAHLFPPVDIEHGKINDEALNAFRKSIKAAAKIGLPNCSYPAYISTALMKLNYSRIPYTIFPDGVRYLDPTDQKREWKRKSDADDYCVDRLILSPELTDNTCKGEQDILLICIEESEQLSSDAQPQDIEVLRLVYVTFLGVAMLFLAATAIVHFLLKEKQNIHAWTIQCYVLSQFCFYFFLVIIYVDQVMSKSLPKYWCNLVGVLAHFFGIYTFSWLSIINFDLWWTFRVLQPLNQKGLHFKRFIWYVACATALPIVVVSVSVGLDFFYEDKTCRSTLTIDSTKYPEYGKELCFLSNSAQLFYFYIPVGVLLFINLVFYACTTYKMFNLYKVSQRATSQKHRQSCQLFLKLFLVMGTAWIFQLLHALVDPKESKWYWVILDMTNMFQAVAIFVIFVCKRETVRSLEQKYPVFKGICCRSNGLYRTPTITDRSTEGSTKVSRVDGFKSGGTQHEWQDPQEVIQLS